MLQQAEFDTGTAEQLTASSTETDGLGGFSMGASAGLHLGAASHNLRVTDTSLKDRLLALFATEAVKETRR